MLTKTVEVQEAQTNLKELLSLVQEGTEIVLTEDNIPLARLVPVTLPAGQRNAGLHAGAIWTSEDFDEPLPESFWTGSKRKETA